MIEELGGAGNVASNFTQGLGIDEPLALYEGGGSYYYEADGLGSITSVSDSTGKAVQTYTYDSFGNVTASTGSVTNPFQFTAREFDSETGLYYYRARYYDPTTGRFLSEDRLQFSAGLNFYPYVNNDPTDLLDPTGLAPCLSVNDFVAALNHNARRASTGRCGRYVWLALRAGGLGTVGSHNGKDYGPYLLKNGFTLVPRSKFRPEAGDIVVIQPYRGGNAAGHVSGWNGNQWISDFFQNYYPTTPGGGVYPGSGYRKNRPAYHIYRPTPCPSSAPAEQALIQQLVGWIGQAYY